MPNPRSLRRLQDSCHQEISPLVRLWLLRLLVPLGGHRAMIEAGTGLNNDELGAVVGLGDWVYKTGDTFSLGEARTDLRKVHQNAERRHSNLSLPPVLAKNIRRLAKLVGLSEVDKSILVFVVHLYREHLLCDATHMLGELSLGKVFVVLSVVLDVPFEQIRAALSAQSVLASSGLLSIDRCRNDVLCNMVDLLSDNFANHICVEDTDPVALLRDEVIPVAPSKLSLGYYVHIMQDVDILSAYLAQATAIRRRDANVLVYGTPGTGKRELVKLLAESLQCELFEVACCDPYGDPLTAERRLRAFKAAQCFLGKKKAVVLFDDVNDVLEDDSYMFSRSSPRAKAARVDRLLEGNPVPTFWVSNSIASLDSTFVRRFDLVVEMPVPPKHYRQHILEREGASWLDQVTLHRLSASAHLSPSVVNRSASVVHSIAPKLDTLTAGEALQRVVNHTLKAQGHPVIHSQGSMQERWSSDVYDPAFVRADADLAQMAAHLAQVKSGRICLFGPPGTGKTAYARWLAEQMGCPLLLKRASDLVSKYHGETEQKLAEAFQQATRDGAVLVLDEVDSFLQDRRKAARSWEVSEVNEMLTQMEAFDGVFVASTNLMSQLDQASLRRFDLKVKFDYLAPEQAVDLFKKYIKLLFSETREMSKNQKQISNSHLEASSVDVALGRIRALRCLTPGDFAAVARQSRFLPLATPMALVAALEKECAAKNVATSAAIGFLA